MNNFKWPKNIVPNENLWFEVLPFMEEDAAICNMRLYKKQGMVMPTKTKKVRRVPENPEWNDIARKIKMLVDEDLSSKLIAKIMDKTPQSITQYIRRYDMKNRKKNK
jgi:hypothetical protein